MKQREANTSFLFPVFNWFIRSYSFFISFKTTSQDWEETLPVAITKAGCGEKQTRRAVKTTLFFYTEIFFFFRTP